MRKLLCNTLIICLLPIGVLNAQSIKPDITRFFKLEIGPKCRYFEALPDSLLSDASLSPFATNLWAYNTYLYNNYSVASKNDSILSSLLPDTVKLRSEFSSLLETDSKFQDIFYTSFNKVSIPPIHIDSIQKIMARFFYLHRLPNDKIVMHFCATINEVFELKQTEYSPYYNAFCYMSLRDKPMFDALYNDIAHYLPTETDNKILEDSKNGNYDIISKHPVIRQMLIDEYESKKQYLNFRILY